ncbi:hypothetical protein ECG_04032 [Echinococcus granulosus]|nr:hypothetical protein ECG_04032 [Echinococcus granulosus]
MRHYFATVNSSGCIRFGLHSALFHVFQVKLEVTSRGVPEARAEIFALLATDDPSLGPISDKAPRTLLGYVDEGAYAFSHGFCIAIGFISLAAVCSLSPTERPSKGFQTVLFRSLKSSNLYGAKMTVII